MIPVSASCVQTISGLHVRGFHLQSAPKFYTGCCRVQMEEKKRFNRKKLGDLVASSTRFGWLPLRAANKPNDAESWPMLTIPLPFHPSVTTNEVATSRSAPPGKGAELESCSSKKAHTEFDKRVESTEWTERLL